ncbi:hypothetical protein, partial [Stenotrophomonas maltophilia]|uniref:hypothetical protein n=1 Tax=Stenotrophomonas maltophilia TaxID=40324 RepID=UPI0031455B01
VGVWLWVVCGGGVVGGLWVVGVGWCVVWVFGCGLVLVGVCWSCCLDVSGLDVLVWGFSVFAVVVVFG